MSAFAKLRKKSGNFADLSKKLDEEKRGGGFAKDERYWELKVDDAGNGYAVLRFLPEPEGEEYPFVKLYEYGFKHKVTGQWYIEKSPETIGLPCPANEKWAELWNAGDKEGAKQFSRSTRYISNVLVISDSKNPENEGKVFLYKYGPRIFQKLEGAMKPEFEDEVAFNPFDFWKGANFKLKARKLDGQRSYDKSEFEKPEPLFGGDDEALEKLYGKLYSLKAELAPEQFKSYDELKKRLDRVCGIAAQRHQASQSSQARQEERLDKVAEAARDDDAPFEGGTSTASVEFDRYQALLDD